MDIIKQTSQFIITRQWLDIPASKSLDIWDMRTIRYNNDDFNTISSYIMKNPKRGWAYIKKERLCN